MSQLIESMLLGRLTEPAWLVRMAVTFFFGIIAVKYLHKEYHKRKMYSLLPSIPMSSVLGAVMGHAEHFWTARTKLHITVCE